MSKLSTSSTPSSDSGSVFVTYMIQLKETHMLKRMYIGLTDKLVLNALNAPNVPLTQTLRMKLTLE